MLSVIYVGDTADPICDKEKERYLDEKLALYPQFNLSQEERKFIKDYLILCARYMEYVLYEEEYNTITLARLLNLSELECNSFLEHALFVMVDCAVQNEDGVLSQDKVQALRNSVTSAKQSYNHDNFLVLLQVLQVDSILNPECRCIVSNLLNTAILRINSHENDAIDALYDKLCGDEYLPFVYHEFGKRSEMLFDNKRLENMSNSSWKYAYSKYEKLPVRLKERLKGYNFQIRLTKELFGKDRDCRKLGSTRIYGKRIRVWMESGRAVIDLSFFHEMGHVADYIIGGDSFYSKTDKTWETVYKMERLSYCNEKLNIMPQFVDFIDYTVSDKTEYFASVFADYIERPEWLKEKAPNSYFCLEALIEKL